MKNLNLILIFFLVFLVTYKSHAQSKIGQTKSDIINTISSENTEEFVNIGSSSDGMQYLLYQDKIQQSFKYIYYFDKSDICISNGCILPSKHYPDLIQRFNFGYKSLGNDTWEDTANNLKITIRAVPNTSDIIIQYAKP